MKIFVFVIISVCVRTIANTAFVNAMIITKRSNSGFYTKNVVSDLRILFNATSFLCITSESEEVLNGILEMFKNDYKIVIFHYFPKPLLNCVRIFILETNNYTVQECEGIIDCSQTTAVYLIKDSITAALQRSLEACLSVAQTPEVLALSLSDSALLQLSPVFPQPRHFVRTSVTQVLERRVDNSKKLDLQGSTLTIGALSPYIPFFMQNNKTTPISTDEYDGTYVELVKEMAHQFNFSCTYVIYKYYGVVLSNGTWTAGGLGHDIQEGIIDIVAVNVWQVPEFFNLMDLGPALNKARMSFLVLRPERIDFQWQAILRIFKPEVWVAIFSSFVLTVMVYWAGVNWDPRPYTENWSGCILTLFGYFTSSTSHCRVDEGNTRFSLTSWSVFSLLITTSLSTGIVTRLTIPFYSPRINTVEQLVKGKYSWTVQFYADFVNNTLLRESMFDLKNHWIQLFEKKYVYMDEEEVANRAGTDKKLVFVAQPIGNEFVVLETDGLDGHKSLNNYRVSKEVFTEAHVSFGMKKQSILFEPLTELTLLIHQAGMMSHWQKEVIKRWPQYDTRHLLVERDIPTFREPQGLPLYKVQPVFLLLLFGLVLSSLVFCIEIYCRSSHKNYLRGIENVRVEQ